MMLLNNRQHTSRWYLDDFVKGKTNQQGHLSLEKSQNHPLHGVSLDYPIDRAFTRKVRLHALKHIPTDLSLTREQRQPLLAEYMRHHDQMLRRYHRQSNSGLRVATARAIILDVLIENIFAAAIQQIADLPDCAHIQVSLLALGGYGRAEVCPLSDVDLMFLYSRNIDSGPLRPFQEELTQNVLYPLWDLGLKVGHSSRTGKEALLEARKDILTRNALLESRYICGNLQLYQRFARLYHRFVTRESPREYIRARLQDQAQRRAKYGKTPFLQEPDIKNGVGGLRDYQNILWMARIRLDLKTLDQLTEENYIRPDEQRQLVAAYDFLLRVRNELHFQSTRPTDVLDLEKQPEIAWQLGYRQRDIFRRIEAFMRDYYHAAQTIDRIAGVIEQRLLIANVDEQQPLTFRSVIEARRADKRILVDGFIMHKGTLSAADSAVFTADPHRLIRVFRHAQQFNCELDFDLQRLIQHNLDLLTPAVANEAGTKRSFRSILQAPGQVHARLLAMHELGVLGRFLPEFDRLTCLVQHEYYHRYTADIHTLNTLAELDALFSGANQKGQNYLAELRKTGNPALLYTALLLHDLGKADDKGDHQQTGANLADQILQRLDYPPEERRMIVHVIRMHLEMSRLWLRYDVDDPATIHSFAQAIEDPEILRYLYVHTYCDALGTASTLWNSYKDMLHTRLFNRTLDHLLGETMTQPEDSDHRQAMLHEFIVNANLSLPQQEIEAHFYLLPERYFDHTGTDEIALHLRMINQLLQQIHQADSIGSLVPIIDWQDDIEQSQTIVTVVTWDRAGLFYKLAGALSVSGLNIISTRAISREDHITIDTFYVSELGGGIVQNSKAKQTFVREVEAVLLHDKDHADAIAAQAKQLHKSLFNKNRYRLRSAIKPSVEVYHELSLQRTIIEIRTNDTLGLLYRLAKVIYEHGFDISFARIGTECGVALDTFYIESIDPHMDPTPALMRLRQAIEDILTAGY